MARDLRLRLTKEELRKLYLEEKRSLEDIARLYGVSRVAVWKYCGAEQLTRRSRSEARLEAQKRGKVQQQYLQINENFFSKWSQKMAYVLGLLMTDGCLSRAKRGSYRLSLCLNDGELLQKVAKAMGSDHAVALSKHQEGLYIFIVGREKLTQALMRLGMTPRKSRNLEFPDVPGEYLGSFIRGVFDGDGCVFLDPNSRHYPLRTNFGSASKNFIRELEATLKALGLPERNIYAQPAKNGFFYSIKYGHKDSQKLFAILYKNAGNGLFLERKYRKFLAGLQGGA